MAKNPKRPAYDLKAHDRRRTWLVQGAMTAIVILFAAGLVLFITKPWAPKDDGNGPPSGDARAVSVTVPDKLVKNPDGTPKVILSMYEDFLCPGCGAFEKSMNPTVQQLIDTGAVQADYYMVALSMHDTPQVNFYASRTGNAAYCVADADPSPTKEKFRKFHSALFAQQPSQSGPFYTNEQIIEMAKAAGVEGPEVSDCINSEKYSAMVKGMVKATGIEGTPTIRINGEDFDFKLNTPPQDLINKITAITGPVPGLPAPGAP